MVSKTGKGWKYCVICCEPFKEWSLRWWVCVTCMKECRCEWHPNWGEKGKRREEDANV
jgi:hypothetical protein